MRSRCRRGVERGAEVRIESVYRKAKLSAGRVSTTEYAVHGVQVRASPATGRKHQIRVHLAAVRRARIAMTDARRKPSQKRRCTNRPQPTCAHARAPARSHACTHAHTNTHGLKRANLRIRRGSALVHARTQADSRVRTHLGTHAWTRDRAHVGPLGCVPPPPPLLRSSVCCMLHVQQFVVYCTLHVPGCILFLRCFIVARPSHVQCGLPLLGDSVYGVRSELIGRQALHAEEVRLARLPCPTPSTGPWRGLAGHRTLLVRNPLYIAQRDQRYSAIVTGPRLSAVLESPGLTGTQVGCIM